MAAVSPLDGGQGPNYTTGQLKAMKLYGYVLKLEGALFMNLWWIMMFVKFGLIWHEGGDPFNLKDMGFHPYWLMIVVIYGVLGFYLFLASYDIPQYRPLLSFTQWTATFAHGIIATICVFSFDNRYKDSVVYTNRLPTYLEGGSYDKLLLASPTWFGFFTLHLLFHRAIWGSNLPPWACGTFDHEPVPPEREGSLKLLKLWMKVEGAVLTGLWLVAHIVKWGLVWHDAGDPFKISDLKAHPYFLMIVVVYGGLGVHLFCAAKDPAAHKALLAWVTWGATWGHGMIATACVFAFTDSQYGYFEGGSYDKLLLACPIWFLSWASHMYSHKASFGTVFLVTCKK